MQRTNGNFTFSLRHVDTKGHTIFPSLSGGELTAVAAKTGQFCIRFHNSTVATVSTWLTDQLAG